MYYNVFTITINIIFFSFIRFIQFFVTLLVLNKLLSIYDHYYIGYISIQDDPKYMLQLFYHNKNNIQNRKKYIKIYK